MLINAWSFQMVNGLNKVDLKEFLDEKYQEYNNVNFIEQDPIQIPHLYTEKKDIEIAGFLTSTIVTLSSLLIFLKSF